MAVDVDDRALESSVHRFPIGFVPKTGRSYRQCMERSGNERDAVEKYDRRKRNRVCIRQLANATIVQIIFFRIFLFPFLFRDERSHGNVDYETIPRTRLYE